MRDRGHTCDICKKVDSAHYKRHKEVFEKVKHLHRLCGSQWDPKSDSEVVERPHAEMEEPNDAEQKDNAPQETVRKTKREKKAVKKQQKAAAREKNVVTDKDVDFVAEVLHPKGAPVESSDPGSVKDIEEADERLRELALRYLTGTKWTRSAESHDTIDFESEMTRIFEAFQISGLVQGNDSTRGLRGKEFSKILSIVADLKNMIVEDLLAVKRDDMEIRMRRAGFVRFVGKSSFDSIETRYEQKDWATGQKIPLEERQPELPGDLRNDEQDDETDTANEDEYITGEAQSPSAVSPMGADVRHTEQSYYAVTRNGHRQEMPAFQASNAVDTPRNENRSVFPRTLRIVETESPTGIKFQNPWIQLKSPDEGFKRLSGLSEVSQTAENKLPSAPEVGSSISPLGHLGTISSTGYDSANEQEIPLKVRQSRPTNLSFYICYIAW